MFSAYLVADVICCSSSDAKELSELHKKWVSPREWFAESGHPSRHSNCLDVAATDVLRALSAVARRSGVLCAAVALWLLVAVRLQVGLARPARLWPVPGWPTSQRPNPSRCGAHARAGLSPVMKNTIIISEFLNSLSWTKLKYVLPNVFPII